jgi:hypothetical protein
MEISPEKIEVIVEHREGGPHVKAMRMLTIPQVWAPNVVQGSFKALMFKKRRRMHPECNNGVRHNGVKQHLLLGKKENCEQDTQADPRTGDCKPSSQVSTRVRKMSVRMLWRGWPLPK